jgi:hypothetical protein
MYLLNVMKVLGDRAWLIVPLQQLCHVQIKGMYLMSVNVDNMSGNPVTLSIMCMSSQTAGWFGT